MRRRSANAAPAAAAGNGAGRFGRAQQGGGVQVVAIGEAGLFSAHGAGAHSAPAVVAGSLDDAVLQHPGFAGILREIQIAPVHAGPQQRAHGPVKLRVAEIRRLQQAAPGQRQRLPLDLEAGGIGRLAHFTPDGSRR